ncbi:hypothetical protein JD78_03909 [Modestobacter roseus]|uniref:Uncharacterized protein n=1 Tax=Modestobacter roseus TaxID=1181884 RepID=A0A562IWZ9_9ACTN|nr:hypothetical protein JD78_03909 [Modestobacter roseus]
MCNGAGVVTPHPGTREYRNQLVRIADLTVLEDVIRDVRFESCVIVGPAVLGLIDDVTLSGCRFNAPGPDALLWPVSASRGSVGAVGLVNVEFRNCELQRIGIAVPEEQIEQFRDDLGSA